MSFDLDTTETPVYGRRKQGTGRSRHGHLAYNSYVVTWAQRGRAMTSELKGGNQARIKASESDRMIGRAERLLPAEHGQITVRGDSGFYSVELMIRLRKRGMRFTFSRRSHLVDVGQARRDPRVCVGRCDRHVRRAGRRAPVHPRRAGSTSP